MAAATFTFDSEELTVWLDVPREGAARAGDLCDRHARTLTAPRGWRVDDRRNGAAGDGTNADGAVHPAESEPVGAPGAMTLDELMHPQTPLLARAFEAAGT